MVTKKIAQTLKEQRVLIFNSSKPEIAPLLAQMGIDEAHLKSGEELYNKVIALSDQQKKEDQEASLAFDNSFEAKSNCVIRCDHNRSIIKMASRKNPDLQQRIKMFIPKERNIEEWINQTLNFYNLVLNEASFLASISKFGITTESLTTDKNDLEALKTLRNEALAETGQSQEATRLRNVKMDDLEDY
ncbi:MAG: hypothetical protein JEZ09_10710 [Salinivirgaceae bacterium]|nr:hypothetical protein [Salinivirgaceae bacterium]